MTTNLWRCARLVKSESRGRRAVTLVEIMAAILVLSIGLVGILAAIPFGGFRMAQMSEADNSAAVGRNALRIMKANHWANPNNWWLVNYFSSNGPQLYGIVDPTDNVHPLVDSDLWRLNLDAPFIIDPLSAQTYLPTLAYYTPGGLGVRYTLVSPLEDGMNGLPRVPSGSGAAYGGVAAFNARLRNWYERFFYQQDDLVSGYAETEDETQFRPQLETEQASLFDWDDQSADYSSPMDVPSYSGRYSWMACVYPGSSTGARYSADLSCIVSADYDVVVFKDRIIGDQKFFAGVVLGSGYQGGEIELDLTSMRDAENTACDSSIDRSRLVDQLEQTRYIMLTGRNSDRLEDGAFPTFTRWYKIANYSVDDENNTLRLTLIGSDTPKTWAGGNTPIAAVFYPGAVGVYSDTCAF